MTLHLDDLLGRDLTFNCNADPGTVQLTVTIVAFDPARGWKLRGAQLSDAWVSKSMFKRLLAAGVLACAMLIAAPGYAQDGHVLRDATAAYAASAAFDVVTSFRCSPAIGCLENNPVLRPFESRPVLMHAVSAAGDAAWIWAARRAFGKRHPRLLAAALYAGATMRTIVAVDNIRVRRVMLARRAQ